MSKLAELSVTLDHLVNTQSENQKLLQAAGVIRRGIGAQDLRFNEKYSLALPYASAQEFENFNGILQNDTNCYKDFVSIYIVYTFYSIRQAI